MRPIARWPVPERLAAITSVVLAALTGSARSQEIANPLQFGGEPPCVLDKCLKDKTASSPSPVGPEKPQGLPPVRSYPGRASTPGNFDFYVLAMSWSPGFCETGGAEHGRAQCEPGTRLVFVVHGLWPQNQHGYPSDCGTNSASPSRMALDAARSLYPDEGLARYEWRKHGTCTGKSPTDYFADVRRARDAIAIPKQFEAPDDQTSWAPLDIARAFVAANPRLRTDTMAVTCRENMLQEVRICFSKDLRGFVSCPEVARASCRRPIDVPPVL